MNKKTVITILLALVALLEDEGRVERGSFTLTLSQNRA